MRYVYDSLATRLGAEIVVVPSPGGDGLSADEERILDAIDDRTALVAISHVLFKSAFVLDIAPIAEKCRRVGALLVLDAYQSVGTLPVSVERLGADFARRRRSQVALRRPRRRLSLRAAGPRAPAQPALTGWMAHPAPFDFEPPPMRRRDDAFRFLLGHARRSRRSTPRGRARGSWRRRASRRSGKSRCARPSRLIALAEERGLRCSTPRDPARRGGTAAVDFENALEVSRELNARDVVVDYRPGVGIRMSPHFYTEDARARPAFEAIDEIRATGAWRRWPGRPSLVT